MAASVSTRYYVTVFLWVVVSLVTGEATNPSMEAYMGMKKFLATLNKRGVKTFTTERGDILYCVDINKVSGIQQPKQNKTETELTPFPLWTKTKFSSYIAMKTPFPAQQQEGGCPEGTVPIKRFGMEEMLRSAKYKSKYGEDSYKAHSGLEDGNQHDVLRTDAGGPFYVIKMKRTKTYEEFYLM